MKNVFTIPNFGGDSLAGYSRAADSLLEANRHATAANVQTPPADQVYTTVFNTPQAVPVMLKLKSEKEYWLLPVEPLVTIGCKNKITKRNVAKATTPGSIKERWSQDDYTLQIDGLLTHADSSGFPKEDLKQLIKYCTARQAIDIASPILLELGIVHIVIEDYSLPFTKGMENQNYSLQAVSDHDHSLLIEINK